MPIGVAIVESQVEFVR
jgi:hypothetical protein